MYNNIVYIVFTVHYINLPRLVLSRPGNKKWGNGQHGGWMATHVEAPTYETFTRLCEKPSCKFDSFDWFEETCTSFYTHWAVLHFPSPMFVFLLLYPHRSSVPSDVAEWHDSVLLLYDPSVLQSFTHIDSSPILFVLFICCLFVAYLLFLLFYLCLLFVLLFLIVFVCMFCLPTQEPQEHEEPWHKKHSNNNNHSLCK